MMDKEQLKWFVFGSIISADNDEFTEDQKQEVMRRYDKYKNKDITIDWVDVLEPVDKTGRLVELFN